MPTVCTAEGHCKLMVYLLTFVTHDFIERAKQNVMKYFIKDLHD